MSNCFISLEAILYDEFMLHVHWHWLLIQWWVSTYFDFVGLGLTFLVHCQLCQWLPKLFSIISVCDMKFRFYVFSRQYIFNVNFSGSAWVFRAVDREKLELFNLLQNITQNISFSHSQKPMKGPFDGSE